MWRHPGFTSPLLSTGLGLLQRGLDLIRATRPLIRAQRRLFSRGHVRAVNYHGTPGASAQTLREHFQFYQDHFSPVSCADLEQFFRDGCWRKEKPGLIISFDDGLQSNFETAYPLLQEFGFVGWFFVPTDFVGAPISGQRQFAAEHLINADGEGQDARVAMSWDQVRRLSTDHVVGCHTKTHLRLSDSVSDRHLEEEIVEAKALCEKELGQAVDVFAWVGGEESSYGSAAADCIRQAGYRYSFMTNSAPIHPRTNPLQLQRTNVEAEWPLHWVVFQLCGVLDLLYGGKRRRVRRRIAGVVPPDRSGTSLR